MPLSNQNLTIKEAACYFINYPDAAKQITDQGIALTAYSASFSYNYIQGTTGEQRNLICPPKPDPVPVKVDPVPVEEPKKTDTTQDGSESDDDNTPVADTTTPVQKEDPKPAAPSKKVLTSAEAQCYWKLYPVDAKAMKSSGVPLTAQWASFNYNMYLSKGITRNIVC